MASPYTSLRGQSDRWLTQLTTLQAKVQELSEISSPTADLKLDSMRQLLRVIWQFFFNSQFDLQSQLLTLDQVEEWRTSNRRAAQIYQEIIDRIEEGVKDPPTVKQEVVVKEEEKSSAEEDAEKENNSSATTEELITNKRNFLRSILNVSSCYSEMERPNRRFQVVFAHWNNRIQKLQDQGHWDATMELVVYEVVVNQILHKKLKILYLKFLKDTGNPSLWTTLENFLTRYKEQKMSVGGNKEESGPLKRKREDFGVANEEVKKEKILCLFCKQKFHSVYHCPAFKGSSYGTKWAFVNATGYCQRCLKEAHGPNAVCNLVYNCRHCGAESHHSQLCEEFKYY